MPTSIVATPEVIDLINNLATLNLGYLGIAVTILVFFGGAFYLFNFKPIKDNLEKQERIINELKKEIEKNIISFKEKMEKDFDNFKNVQNDEISNLVTQRDEKLLSDIQTKIVTFEKDFTENFNSFADKKDVDLKVIILAETSGKIQILEKNIISLASKVKAENEKESSNVMRIISSLQSDLKELKRTNRILEVFMYSQKGQMGAIYGCIDLLRDAIDENTWRIGSSLEDLSKEIDGIKLEGEVITRIEEQLVRLSKMPKYSPLVAKIRKHYQQ